MSQKLPPFFYDIFTPSLPRLGPGDDASTCRALGMIYADLAAHPGAPSDPATFRMLDIGCGVGAQTLQLAHSTGGHITAVDNHQPYLDEVMRRAESQGVASQITTHLGDMAALDMPLASYDLVWAEGSLFVMGFNEGLAACHDLLAPGGYLGASELVWLRNDAPAECREFWNVEYPPITGIEENLAAIWRSGFDVIGHFILPESSWWDPFYLPLEKRLQSFRLKYAADPEKIGIIESLQAEIENYRKYSAYSGYAFFVMRKR